MPHTGNLAKDDEAINLQKYSTTTTLLGQHNSLLCSKSYPYKYSFKLLFYCDLSSQEKAQYRAMETMLTDKIGRLIMMLWLLRL